MKLLVTPRHFALGGTHLLFSSVVGPVFRRKVWSAYDKQKNVPYKTSLIFSYLIQIVSTQARRLQRLRGREYYTVKFC